MIICRSTFESVDAHYAFMYLEASLIQSNITLYIIMIGISFLDFYRYSSVEMNT